MSRYVETHSWNAKGDMPSHDSYEATTDGHAYEVTMPTATTVGLRRCRDGVSVSGNKIGLHEDRPHPFEWHKPYGAWDRPYGCFHDVRPVAVYRLDDNWAGGRFNIYPDGVAEKVVFGSGRPVVEAGYGRLR